MWLLVYLSLFSGLSTATSQPPIARGCACAPSLAQRDLATITSAFSSVGSGISNLDAAVKALNGAGDIANLQSASTRLLDAVKSGTTAVQASSNLSLQEAVQLQQVVTGIQAQGNSLGSSLAAKKTTIERLGLCKIFALQSNGITTASKGLSDAVVSKVPQAAQAIAAELASGFTNTLTATQALFAEGNCTNSASGSTQPAPASPSGGGGAGGRGNTTFISAASGVANLPRGIVGGLGLAMAGLFIM